MIQTILNYVVIIGVCLMMIVVLYRKMKLKGKGFTGEVLVLDEAELNTVKWAMAYPEKWAKVEAGVISETKRLSKKNA